MEPGGAGHRVQHAEENFPSTDAIQESQCRAEWQRRRPADPRDRQHEVRHLPGAHGQLAGRQSALQADAWTRRLFGVLRAEVPTALPTGGARQHPLQLLLRVPHLLQDLRLQILSHEAPRVPR